MKLPPLEAIKKGNITTIKGITVLTDKPSYSGRNQVFPLHPENIFFIDELKPEKLVGAKVLEIGVGSGILSIAVVKKGASHVVGLETSPRARNYAGFNILLNGVADHIEIKEGHLSRIFAPVSGQRFDYIISNPPFEPTPPSLQYYLHSAGGVHGLDFVEKLLMDLESHLTLQGHAQIVTFSPGNKEGPFMLKDLAKRYLNGHVTIKVDPLPMLYSKFLLRFLELGVRQEEIESMIANASKEGVSHLYLCMLHYEKGPQQVEIVQSETSYENWDLPLGAKKPMGVP